MSDDFTGDRSTLDAWREILAVLARVRDRGHAIEELRLLRHLRDWTDAFVARAEAELRRELAGAPRDDEERPAVIEVLDLTEGN